MRPVLLPIAACCAALSLGASPGTTVDSLRTALAKDRQDSARFKTLMAMAGEWLETSPDSAYACCLRALAVAPTTQRPDDVGEVEGWLGYIEEQRGHIPEAIAHYERSLGEAERLKDHKGITTVLNNLAAIYKDQGHVEQALSMHERSLARARLWNDSTAQANSLNNIGLILYDQGRIPEALDHYEQALRLYEAKGNAEGTATALHNIAGVHKDQGDYAEALAYFQRAIALHRKQNDAYGMASTEDNIGGVLERMGRTDEALAHYREALRLHESVEDTRGMGYSLRNIAGVELKRGDPMSALDHARRSLQQLQASDDKRGQAAALSMYGAALLQLGRGAEAEQQGQAALALARELGYPAAMRDAAELLQRTYRAEGRWHEALDMQDLFTAMRDSVQNTEARRSAIKQQYQYAYEKKEASLKAAQREQLQKERTRRILLLVGGAVVLLTAIALWSRLRFVRRSRAALQIEKDISEGLLLNILPAEVAQELKEKGHAETRVFDHATILFTDFKGFTEVSEQLGPQALVDELNACFKAFDGIITARGIEKIKTIGDAYMCVGGVPVPGSCTPADVVHAALDMQAFMRTRKAERDAQGLPAFEMRVGIHTGPVVAGIVGVKKFQYDIWGDTVNTASRMESSGEVGRVNISEATYLLVRHTHDLRFLARGKVQAKGKGDLEMYFADRAA